MAEEFSDAGKIFLLFSGIDEPCRFFDSMSKWEKVALVGTIIWVVGFVEIEILNILPETHEFELFLMMGFGFGIELIGHSMHWRQSRQSE